MPARRPTKLPATDAMTVEEASRRTGLHADTIRAGIRNGTFPGSVVAERTYTIPRTWYERWLAGEWTPAPRTTEEAAA